MSLSGADAGFRREPAALLRVGACLLAVAVVAGSAAALASARAAPSPARLCVAILPVRAPLPRKIGLPALAASALPISLNAAAHRALCRVGVYTPSDNARYDVNWYVFPTHALALADVAALVADPRGLYASVSSFKPVAGFPRPAYLVIGTFRYLGRIESIVTISFVDGPALVSGSMLGGGTVAQATALAHWAAADIARLESARSKR